ncbi:MAG: hypothetical protein ABIH26_02705, partial [Candidatus Eisenbacteria bacterium]
MKNIGPVPFSRSDALAFLLALLLGLSFSDALAGGKVGFYGLRLQPNGDDAEEYSDPGWGGGGHVVVPIPRTGRVLAGTIGFEAVNLQN